MINEYLKIKEIGVLDEPLKLCYYSFRNLTIAQNKYYEYKKALCKTLKRVYQGAFVII